MLPSRADRALRLRFPHYSHWRRRRRWDERWARGDAVHGWAVESFPELEEAVATGWFPAGGRVVDIGCGAGDHSALLAAHGYEVLGIDFSRSAIEKALAVHGQLPGARFEVMDIGRRGPAVSSFDALLDRGTLQLVAPKYQPAYARNVAAAAKPGARFLLLYPTALRRQGYHDTSDEVRRRVAHLLDPFFETEQVTDAAFGVETERGPHARGLAFWLARRSG
jgi:SAM-dependent methyltransferase